MRLSSSQPFNFTQSHQPPATVSLADVSSEGAGTEVDRVDCWCRASRHFYFIKDVVTTLMVQKPRAVKFLIIQIFSVILLEIDFFQFCWQIFMIIETRLILTCGVSVVTLQS